MTIFTAGGADDGWDLADVAKNFGSLCMFTWAGFGMGESVQRRFTVAATCAASTVTTMLWRKAYNESIIDTADGRLVLAAAAATAATAFHVMQKPCAPFYGR